MRALRAAAVARTALALLAACAGSSDPDRESPNDAELRVEVYSGFGTGAPTIAPAPVHAVVDITALLSSPEDANGPAPRQLALARELTEAYFEQHPDLAGPEIHPFHRRGPAPSGERCAELGSGGEFYASQALAQLREELAQRKQQSDARVLLFTRFENECEPRLCQAAAELVAPGSWLEVVGVGLGNEPPACLTELRPNADTPSSWLADWRTSNAPAFAVETYPAAGEGDEGVLSRGQAWGAPLRISPGLRQIRIELDPPALIGPVRIAAGQKLRVRLLDFPLSAPGERAWRVETIDEPAAN